MTIERRFSYETLQDGVALRSRLLKAVTGFSLRDADRASTEMEALAEGYRSLQANIGELPESSTAILMAEALGIAALVCRWGSATLKADTDAQRFLQAARAKATLLVEEAQASAGFADMRSAVRQWLADVHAIADTADIRDTVAALGRIPLPVFYSAEYDPYAWVKQYQDRQESALEERHEDPVVKVIFSLDGKLWVVPQAVQSQIQYDLGIEVDVSQWPQELPLLQIDYVSTMDPRTYSMTAFTLPKPERPMTVRQSGHLLFSVPQNMLSEPAVIKVRARFVSEEGSNPLPATVIGYPELRLRALDRASYPILSTYPVVDLQIVKIVGEVQQTLPDLSSSDLDDFTRCLVALGQYAGMVLQSGVFKGRAIDEKRDFQQHLLQSLRMTVLGQEVCEGETSSGGIFDLRYRNIVIELKLEKELKDRAKLREKYISQPAQYTAASIPISITCILDMVEKENPPANVANNMTLETPILHGFEATSPAYPSKVAVIIIDGNLKSPSDYS